MLRKLGWWAVGVGLESACVGIGLVWMAMNAMGFALHAPRPGLVTVALWIGLAAGAGVLTVPGYVAARFGDAGELMGLAVGTFVAVGLIAVIRPMIYTVWTDGDPLSVWTTAALEALLLVLPPALGGWWARREAEDRCQAESQADPRELVPGAPARPSS
jgi:hypothetical protein